MFKFLIIVRPLGLLYGSAGAFLSPENLVGRSGSKFPPDAATLSGLILSTNREQTFTDHQELKMNLTVAGAFWARDEDFQHGNQDFYVPIPRSLIIAKDKTDQWEIQNGKWHRPKKDEDIEAAYHWQTISTWGKPVEFIRKQGVSEVPWKFVPMLHPTLDSHQRRVRIPKDDTDKGSLFLENAVQMQEGSFLVYLSTHVMPDGWYRFGGENHLVEITSQSISSDILNILNKRIERQFALISPAVWGTNSLSCRYPKDVSFSNRRPEMLTDRPIPFRHRMVKNNRNQRTNTLSVGRYAVPAGTVYIVKHPLNMTWWDFPPGWFPQSNENLPIDQRPLPLKHLGCGLCLPIRIKGA
ncbi:MAG: CRISPR-associated protein [Leptolyngbya sp. IPPAS B-1204]|nr:MAG: CRISPR-associated protein [Leptolyngbya sp. IPPAS B-1204]